MIFGEEGVNFNFGGKIYQIQLSKVCVSCIFKSLCFKYKRDPFEKLWKIFFISLQKLFSVS